MATKPCLFRGHISFVANGHQSYIDFSSCMAGGHMAMNHTVNFALGLLVAMPMFGCKYLMKESFLEQKLKYHPNLLVEFFKKNP